MNQIVQPALAMPDRAFERLAADVHQVLQLHGVAAYLDSDRERLNAALWDYIHPDLVDAEE
ncbi:hypothetical protein [Actinomadura rupiterrae]|uniref:hypothetical protein n=1 Tax=Actinomadura rupiterrae TaxID=559627 RepID=UPI0020A25116|nr:hypothetical protein [Actinomadura rupiterrae]MCP2337893.1 hypothetical protein [Actinomadura rupiterrae]